MNFDFLLVQSSRLNLNINVLVQATSLNQQKNQEQKFKKEVEYLKGMNHK